MQRGCPGLLAAYENCSKLSMRKITYGSSSAPRKFQSRPAKGRSNANTPPPPTHPRPPDHHDGAYAVRVFHSATRHVGSGSETGWAVVRSAAGKLSSLMPHLPNMDAPPRRLEYLELVRTNRWKHPEYRRPLSPYTKSAKKLAAPTSTLPLTKRRRFRSHKSRIARQILRPIAIAGRRHQQHRKGDAHAII